MTITIPAAQETQLALVIRAQADGPELLCERLAGDAISDLRSEAWHHSHLRKGFADVPLDGVEFHTEPIYRAGNSGPLSGFALLATNPAGEKFRYEFTQEAVEHMAVTASLGLVQQGLLQPGDTYVYELAAVHSDAANSAPLTSVAGIQVTKTSSPLKHLRHPLSPLLKAAKPVGPQESFWSTVFYEQEALKKTETFARRGGNRQPAEETGCILVAALCSCPETGEFYVVVRDALEAQATESGTFSLEYTGETWTRMQRILRARQTQPGCGADRFGGQAHLHPFEPAGGPPCELCLERPDLPCGRTSCFVSHDDRTWSRAVFPRQPWQLCHIFGVDARKDNVDKLFGLHNGQLLERGYHVIEKFKPDKQG
jgi:hypothetical protein